MKKNSLLCVFTFVIIVLFFGRAFSEDVYDEKDAFVEELIKQHELIRDELTYNYVKINATRFPNETEISEDSAEIKKLDEQHISSTKSETKTINNAGSFTESVTVSNPSYSFSLIRKNKDGKWRINSIQQLKGGVRREAVIDVLGGSVYSFLNVNTVPLASLLTSENVEMEKFVKNEIDGETTINMTLLIQRPEIEIDHCYVGFEKVELLFLPKKCGYIPKEFTYYQGESSKRVIRDQFQNVGRFIIPFDCQTYFNWGSNPYLKDYEGSKVFAQKKFDKSEFYLSYYGLPEPDFENSSANRVRYILMTLGALMILYSGWRIYRKRQIKSGDSVIKESADL